MDPLLYFSIEELKEIINFGARALKLKSLNSLLFCCNVNFKSILGLDRLFTCLLKYSEKSVKDNNSSGMFIIALKMSKSLFWTDRLVEYAALHLGALLVHSLLFCPYFITKDNKKHLCETTPMHLSWNRHYGHFQLPGCLPLKSKSIFMTNLSGKV